MELIETLDPAGFSAYLKATKNTICGRNPISILLHVCSVRFIANGKAIKVLGTPGSLKFLAYAQSSKCVEQGDSSVSYAAASYVM